MLKNLNPPSREREPEVAIIIPVWGHAVLLAEAIESALSQKSAREIGIVIVSDGCLQAETHLVASAFSTSYENITYLRRKNGGPSAARNYGIEFVLRSWPLVEAVFFLDADNRLSATSLDDALKALKEAPEIGWAYAHITSFGISWSANYGMPYSPLLHIVHDNMCDTGSLVKRTVLEAGVRFDEDAKSGYEDWDFWLQCLALGFLGKHVPFGFAYRQRPESRFREMNRKRGAMIEHLRQRHSKIASPKNLLRWEHEGNQRYLFLDTRTSKYELFTDPANSVVRMTKDEVCENFFAGMQAPDDYLIPAFFMWGSNYVRQELERLGLVHAAFSLLEREAGKTAFAVLTISQNLEEIAINIGPFNDIASARSRGKIWICTAKVVREIVADAGDSWVTSLNSENPIPVMTEIHVAAPFDKLDDLDKASESRQAAESCAGTPVEAVLATMSDLRKSKFSNTVPVRWNWRGQHFPAREDYYRTMCRYLGVSALPSRLSSGKVEVALVVPIASYGGAEKVAYAMARSLKASGIYVHLLIMGTASYRIIPEYDAVFDSVDFLAEVDYPRWGGPVTVFGQQCFLPDAPEVKGPEVVGRLCMFDLVVNCHSAPLNSLMGTLRLHGVKTATYLHVFDTTPLQRLAGHPYLTLGFEHAYDLILTCSKLLADDMHSLGLPSNKVLPIQNAASFNISDLVKGNCLIHRRIPRSIRALRVLYIGRLDRQKGVERLYLAAEAILATNLAVEFRIIGSSIIDTNGDDWEGRFGKLGIMLEPPVYATGALAEAYAWADVLLLPSRWEGAPLVIPEAHQVGCIPIATDVGAVNELMTHEVDGFLVKSQGDQETASEIVGIIGTLLHNDNLRILTAENAMKRSSFNQWDHNFEPLLDWITDTFPLSAAAAAAAADTKSID